MARANWLSNRPSLHRSTTRYKHVTDRFCTAVTTATETRGREKQRISVLRQRLYAANLRSRRAYQGPISPLYIARAVTDGRHSIGDEDWLSGMKFCFRTEQGLVSIVRTEEMFGADEANVKLIHVCVRRWEVRV